MRRLKFRHEIARLAVQDAIPAHRRGQIHARILDALRGLGCDDDARLAFHAEAAGDGPAALGYAAAAARRAAAWARTARPRRSSSGHSGSPAGRIPRRRPGCTTGWPASWRRWTAGRMRPTRVSGRSPYGEVAGDRLREGDTMRSLPPAPCARCAGATMRSPPPRRR